MTTDMRVMLDLDSPSLRDMLARRLYEADPVMTVVGERWEEIRWEAVGDGEARTDSYAEADVALAALRGLAADGLLVRG